MAIHSTKYEIEYTYFPGFELESEIATLTGLQLEDILPYTEGKTRWTGRNYIDLFQQLGYSCNPRFIKFDKETPWPCIMRTKKPRCKKYWYGFVYYDGLIYVPGAGKAMTWANWNWLYPNYRITSMLQVWVEANTSLKIN